jgi:hypothetical protein
MHALAAALFRSCRHKLPLPHNQTDTYLDWTHSFDATHSLQLANPRDGTNASLSHHLRPIRHNSPHPSMTASRRGPRPAAAATLLLLILVVIAVVRSADARSLKQSTQQSGLVPATTPAADAAAATEADGDVADALSPYNPNTAGPAPAGLPANAAVASDDDPVGVSGNNGAPTSSGGYYIPSYYGPAVAVSTVGGGYRPRSVAYVGYGGWGRGWGGGGWGRGWGGGGWGRGGWGRGGGSGRGGGWGHRG